MLNLTPIIVFLSCTIAFWHGNIIETLIKAIVGTVFFLVATDGYRKVIVRIR